MRTRLIALAAVACVLTFSACSDDEGDSVARASEEATDAAAQTEAGSNNGNQPAPQPEQSVPALTETEQNDITVGGYIFETGGVFLMCESISDDDPPSCEGETLEISNGDVIDETIFLGDPGSRYSDGQVVVTGDVSDGVLTIG